jgi:hypothetical protein
MTNFTNCTKKRTAVDIRDGWIFVFSVASEISDLFLFSTLPFVAVVLVTAPPASTRVLEHKNSKASSLVPTAVSMALMTCVRDVEKASTRLG